MITRKVLQIILKLFSSGKESLEKFAKEKLAGSKEKTKKFILITFLILFSTFLFTIPLLYFGFITDSKTLISFAALLRAGCFYVLKLLIAPIILALSIPEEGFRESIRSYIRTLNGTFISELLLMTAISWLPIKNNLDSVFPLILIVTVLGWILPKAMSRKVSIAFASILLCLILLSFSYTIEAFMTRLFTDDKKEGLPMKVTMTCDDIQNGKYPLFEFYGFFEDPRTKAIEVFEFRSKNRSHPVYGETIKSFKTKDDIFFFENYICKKERKEREAEEEKAKKEAEEEKKREQAEKASRKEYAIIVLDGNGYFDYPMTERFVSSVSGAINAYEYIANFPIQGGQINYYERMQIAKIAKKIVILASKTELLREEQNIKHYYALLSGKVLDSETGDVLRHIRKDVTAISVMDNKARTDALDIAVTAAENELKKL
ncbi:MAG TPA: hypothetical protein DIT25_02045 [Candidatus Moranbacteria bacterium]|nr:hypothetical protein [Candidatus Moranbacteria bacterium]